MHGELDPYATEPVSVDPGKEYRSRSYGYGCRPVGVAVSASSGQEQVVYRRLDTGQLVACSLAHWHNNYAEVT